jgi:ABC-type phosphate transport system substrate-binding protein
MSLLIRLGSGCALLAASLAGSVAMADVVAVVSAQSTVTVLNKTQLVDLFLGKARRFPNGTVALPIDQAEGSPARDEFYKTFADKSPAQIKAYWSKIVFTGRGRPPPAVANGLEMKKRIAANSAAIGYIERSLLDASIREIP